MNVSIGAGNSVNITIGSGMFRIGGTRLSENGSQLLTQIAQQLTTQPDAVMTVIGYTDNVPVGAGNRFGSNEALSFARAVSTVEFLKNQGVSANRLSAAGYGADNPIANNDTCLLYTSDAADE